MHVRGGLFFALGLVPRHIYKFDQSTAEQEQNGRLTGIRDPHRYFHHHVPHHADGGIWHMEARHIRRAIWRDPWMKKGCWLGAFGAIKK